MRHVVSGEVIVTSVNQHGREERVAQEVYDPQIEDHFPRSPMNEIVRLCQPKASRG